MQQGLLSRNLLHEGSQDCPLDTGSDLGNLPRRKRRLRNYRLSPVGYRLSAILPITILATCHFSVLATCLYMKRFRHFRLFYPAKPNLIIPRLFFRVKHIDKFSCLASTPCGFACLLQWFRIEDNRWISPSPHNASTTIRNEQKHITGL